MTDSKRFFAKLIHILFLLLLVLSFLVVLYTGSLPHTQSLINNEQAQLFMKDWTYVSRDGISRIVNLPSSLEENIPDGIRVSRTLPQTCRMPVSIAKYCIFEKCSIYLDNRLIFRSDDPYQKQRHLDKTSGSFWIMQELPPLSAGKTITIEITSPYRDYRRMDTPIYLGTASSILFAVVHVYFWRLSLSLLMILSGLFTIIFFSTSRKRISFDSSFFYLGWFLFWLGGWTFSECHLTQLITGNSIFITILSFTALRMSIITFMHYYLLVFSARWKKWNLFLTSALYLEAAVSASLQLLQIRDYYETLSACLILLVCVLLSILFENTAEVFFFHNTAYPYLYLCSLILAVFSLADLIRFHFFTHYGVGQFIGIGIIITVLIVSYHEVKKVRYSLELARNARYFRSLANTDPMTGCFNRNILQEWLTSFEQESPEKKSQFAVLVCDLDHLKEINDRFGHPEGDHAICRTAELLKSSFADSGICCRTGGDEFLCLLYGLSEEALLQKLHFIHHEILQIDLSCDYTFSVSFGYAFHSGSLDSSLNQTIHRADQEMYTQKHILSKNK